MSQHDDPFQEIGRTLDVLPSRNFAQGVHARISRRRLVVRATMSGFAIAASVMLALVMRGPATATIEPPALMADIGSPAPAMPVATPDPATPAAAPATRVAVSRPATVTPAVEVNDRLLVVTNQMAVLQAAWAGHQATATEIEAPPVEVVTPSDPPPVVVDRVHVLPVVIADQRPPITGLPIIRRAVAALESK